MRKKVIAGNWKMNKSLNESQELVSKIINGLGNDTKCDVIVCPPFTSLSEVHSLIKNTPVKMGAQNMYHEESGAYTGEISADMLISVGCEYVILGHSERRAIFNESNKSINNKIKAALNKKLIVIFCVGELLEQREKGITTDVVSEQITKGLDGISSENMSKVIIAYEPVWAIGTGKTATPQQAQDVHSFIRELIAKIFSSVVADNLIIQYGGSVKPDNASELLTQKDIDGALVGGACLKADSFLGIIASA
ncbi:MAG: triose-phosphate isomerase [Ignavibacteria bacterium]|nr:triose-phosphate isomerase [Ignavibacteria bacterium]MBT8382081.1 triose-phosphate isomerase [Ignavibacteria bacterium]MBT8390225.1 triose-phosphate isomerase [Ignavibacteria bacterium]NNJ52822.1 triose-phosphate isomerase [Ignavibacteriaceae bacterium]NNL20878.1 triose-phosphate isomerase [Ignavibacteriaceae bacterium]